MAGTHEENLKDPVWQAEQAARYKDELRKLQEKYDAQLAGIAEDKKTIASLNDALATASLKIADCEAAATVIRSSLRNSEGNLRLSQAANADLLAQLNAAQALAKSRRAGLAQVAAVINPLLAAE